MTPERYEFVKEVYLVWHYSSFPEGSNEDTRRYFTLLGVGEKELKTVVMDCLKEGLVLIPKPDSEHVH